MAEKSGNGDSMGNPGSLIPHSPDDKENPSFSLVPLEGALGAWSVFGYCLAS